MQAFQRGNYTVRPAGTPAEIEACQRLRHLAFRDPGTGLDVDAFDRTCIQMLIEDTATATLVACFRILPLPSGAKIAESYSAQFYDLTPLHRFKSSIAELGRFCGHPAHKDPDILRLFWVAMGRYVDADGIELLFGCSSFKGTDPLAYKDTLALLRARHLAPPPLQPGIKASSVYPYAKELSGHRPDLKSAMAAMPPLLRSYLILGGWVSDHAVIDKDLGTLHVFTGLEIRAIPETRKRLLRASAG